MLDRSVIYPAHPTYPTHATYPTYPTYLTHPAHLTCPTYFCPAWICFATFSTSPQTRSRLPLQILAICSSV